MHRQQLRQCGLSCFGRIGENHLAHGDDAIGLEEHMFRAAQPHPLRAETSGGGGIVGRVGVGANLQPTDRIGPRHQRGEVAGQFGLAHWNPAPEHLSRRPVDRDDIAALKRDRAGRQYALHRVDLDRTRTGHARAPHTARNHRRMARHTAACRQYSACRVHAVNVFRARLHAHEDDGGAVGRELFGFLGGKRDLPGRRARRRRKPRRDAFLLCIRIECGMEKLIERLRIDPRDRDFLVDQPLAYHVDRDFER